ncbi:MAG TPA: hypothetical protein VGP07_15155 [Polyangia bacterium]
MPLLILAPTLRGYTAMVCRMTGAVTPTDCAPAIELADPAVPSSAQEQGAEQGAEQGDEQGDERGESGPGRWLDESCCDFVRVTFAQPPADAVTRFEHALQLVASLPALQVVSRAVWTAPPLDRGAPAQPGLGPPRRLVTQTFLI